MAKKLVKDGTIAGSVPGHVAKVYYDSDLEEFSVKFYKAGVYQVNADYFTDCSDDALSTAGFFVNNA